MIEIHLGWVIAGIAVALAAIVGVILWSTRRRAPTLLDSVDDLATKHVESARRESTRELELAKAAGVRAVAESDARVKEEVSRATSAGFAAHMRELDAQARERDRDD